jgi:tetratricopeptide (TPR) repeat protein
LTPLSQQDLEAQQPPCWWDYILELLLIVLLAFAPLAKYGSRDARGQEVVLGLCAAMALCLSAKHLFRRDLNYVWSWAYLPIVLFFVLVAVQLFPLPARILGIISPHTLETKTALLQDLPNAQALLRSLTITFYPLATRNDLQMVLAAATVFFVVVNVYRRPAEIKRLLLAISIIGTVVALLALWQNLTGARLIYGIYPMGHINSGPFKNHSHFGQFMNLSIGAMLALILVHMGEMTAGVSRFGDTFRHRSDFGFKVIWVLVIAILLSAGMILLSFARAASVAVILAGGVTGVVWVVRHGRSHAGSVAAIFGFAVLVLGVYASGPVFNRLLTLRHAAEDNGDRGQILRDLSVEWRQFPLVGTGLGTHEFVFPMFDRSTEYAMAVHAENDYAELLEECGFVGLGLCIVFLGIVITQYVRSVWVRRRPIHLAAFGLGYGLIAILLQTGTDFSQHVPGVACLTAVICGLVIVLGRLGQPRTVTKSYNAGRHKTWISLPIRAGMAVMAIAAFAWSVPAARVSVQAQKAWDDAEAINAALTHRGWDQASVEDYFKVLRPATQAAEIQPNDAKVQYRLNDLRWRLISRTLPLSREEVPFARQIVDELDTARAKCPTFGPNFVLAGQIELYGLGIAAGAEHIRTGYRLDHNDPGSSYALAILDAEQGQWDASLADAHRALALDKSLLNDFLRTYVSLRRPDIAYTLVAGDRDGLWRLSDILQPHLAQRKLAERCISESNALLVAQADRADAIDGILEAAGQYYAGRGNDQKAVGYLQRAVLMSKNYGVVDWRYNLAVALKRSGQFDAAVREARICLVLRPRMKEAQALLDSMNARRLGE